MSGIGVIRDVTIAAKRYLKTPEICIFVGARQAGKTTILRQLQEETQKTGETSYSLNLEDPDYLAALNASPKKLLEIFPLDLNHRAVIFIDEIQYLENPSNFLKYFYDEYQGKIKLLVSGSSAFYLDRKFKDSLAGRKRIFNVWTLSFREFLRFRGEEELARRDLGQLSLSEKEKAAAYYREYLVYGGYPRLVLSPLEEKIEVLKDIAYSYIKKDILETGVRQDEIFYKLFKILAAQIGGLVNASELALTLGVSKTSIDSYLHIMQKSFHIQLIAPFFRNVRKELTKMPKIYFLDLGLRNFFADNFKQFAYREDRGALLENAVFRQLLEQYDAGEIKFWRTINKQEVDFVAPGKKAWEVKVDPRRFRVKDYQLFLDTYPDMPLTIASFNVSQEKVDDLPVIEPWQI